MYFIIHRAKVAFSVLLLFGSFCCRGEDQDVLTNSSHLANNSSQSGVNLSEISNLPRNSSSSELSPGGNLIETTTNNSSTLKRNESGKPSTVPNGTRDTVGVSLISESEEKDLEKQGEYGANRFRSVNLSILPIPDGYNKWELPKHPRKKWRVYVYVSMFIRQFLDIDETKEELTIDTDIGLQWVDWKIADNLKKKSDPNIIYNHTTLDAEVLREIWKPDIFIDQLASTERTQILNRLITLNLLGGDNRGDIAYSARTGLKLRCEMSYEHYPADTQTCTFIFRSYSYNASKLLVIWNSYSDDTKGIYLNYPGDPNFDIQVFSASPSGGHGSENFLYVEEKFDDFRSGNYSALSFVVKFRRKLSYHLVQTYLPSVLLNLITWLCFLLPGDMVEARIGISMTTVLTLTAMFAAVREQAPVVSYPMAIDLWMIFCISFVFIALLLFTCMYWIKRNLAKHQSPGESDNLEIEGVLDAKTHKELGPLLRKVMTIANKYAFLGFSITFITFLTTYWTWLLIASEYFAWSPNPDYNAISTDEDDHPSNFYRFHDLPEDPYKKAADGL